MINRPTPAEADLASRSLVFPHNDLAFGKGDGEGLTKKGFLEALEKVNTDKKPKTERKSPYEARIKK